MASATDGTDASTAPVAGPATAPAPAPSATPGPVPPISLVVPAYDERDRIGPFLDDVAAWIATRPDVEVVVVDDGSTDGTGALVARWTDRIPGLRVEVLPANRGKGAAVRRGFEVARGRYRVFLDADGSTPVAEVDTLVAAAGDRDDVVAIGSIAVEGAVVEQTQLALRQWAGRLGNRLIQRLAVPGVRDTQRGAKLVSDRWCHDVLPSCTVDGWAFDVELLALSERAGYRIREVPVHWRHVEGTKVTAASYLRTLGDVVRIRRRLRALERAGALPRLGTEATGTDAGADRPRA